MRSYMPLLISI